MPGPLSSTQNSRPVPGAPGAQRYDGFRGRVGHRILEQMAQNPAQQVRIEPGRAVCLSGRLRKRS